MTNLQDLIDKAEALVAVKRQELSDAQVELNKLILERIRYEAEEYQRAQNGWGKFLILEEYDNGTVPTPEEGS